MSARVGLGYSYNENWHVTLGLTRLSGRAHAVSGADTISNTEMEEGGIDFRFVFDTRDDIDFPSRGTVVDASWNHYLGTFGSESAFRQWRIHAGKYFDYQQHNLGSICTSEEPKVFQPSTPNSKLVVMECSLGYPLTSVEVVIWAFSLLFIINDLSRCRFF